jgi:AraC-like DNA-binding protein
MNICDYISDHCTEPLTLDMAADLSGFSKYHFTRLFKQFTNVSFYKYLNLKRIAKAEQLLINPDLSITDVALSSGFSSLSAFIRMFKIIKGCTPSEFRSIYDL